MLRQVLRPLLRAPAFSLTVILTVALGIGVNTAIFGLIYSVLLDPLPFRDPERLVQISETHPEFPSFPVPALDYAEWRRTASSFEESGAYTFQAMNQATLLGRGEPERVQATQASAQLFGLLGVAPLVGRAYTVEEDAKKAPVILLSEELWKRKFGADPGVVGQAVRLDGQAFTVVGVVPKRQAFPAWTDLWMPLSLLDPAVQSVRKFHALEVVGRLKPGVGADQAQAEMRTIAGNLATAFPKTNANVGASVIPLASGLTGAVRPALLIAWAAVGLVLLLACANVAHLVMIRSVSRRQEMAVRAALGASSMQLARTLLAENLILALAGGVVGIGLAALTLPILGRFAGGDVPRVDGLGLTPVTAAFGGAAALVCALLFAMPALFQVRRTELQQTIRRGSGLTMGTGKSWFGPTIIAAEVALAFVVITGAGLLYRSFDALRHEDSGFDARGVVAVEVTLAAKDWQRAAVMFEQQLAPRIRQIPGVTTVAAANSAPMTLSSTEQSRFATRFGVVGRTFEPGRFPVAQLRWVTPDYFRTLRIPLKSGRFLADGDLEKPVYVINETLARQFFPGEDPVGRQLLNGVTGPNPQAIPIAGVVGDVRDLGLDVEPRPTLYLVSVSPGMTLLVGGEGNSAELLLPSIREAVRAVDPEAPVTKAAPLTALMEASAGRRRFALYLLSAFAMLAAVLTAIGVYGVIAYSVSRRVREFAIRFALGAQRRDLGAMILRNFAVPAGVGLAAGGWLAWLFAQAMRTQLYKVSAADPWVLGGTVAGLALLVAISAAWPAMRAASVPAGSALRE